MANKRLSKEKQALVLAALCEGTPIEAVARMFKIGTNTITRVIRETGEAFTDYMDKNFRDLPCVRIEMDEQWQYVGCHAGRLPKDDKTERGDYWLWACIDADTKLVFSHKVGKRDWWTGNTFVEDVRNRVRLISMNETLQAESETNATRQATVIYRIFPVTHSWEADANNFYYCGDSVSWALGLDGQRHYRGGAVSTDRFNAPMFEIKKAWKAVYRLRRLGFYAEICLSQTEQPTTAPN